MRIVWKLSSDLFDVAAGSACHSGSLLRPQLCTMQAGAAGTGAIRKGWTFADRGRKRAGEGHGRTEKRLPETLSGRSVVCECGSARDIARSGRRRRNTALCTRASPQRKDLRAMARRCNRRSRTRACCGLCPCDHWTASATILKNIPFSPLLTSWRGPMTVTILSVQTIRCGAITSTTSLG